MNTNDLKKRLSLIDEESRLDLGISRDEYALCSYVYFRSQDTRQKIAGWCCDSKVEVAEFCGIARSSFYNVAHKMQDKGLVEISKEWHLRPSSKWAIVEKKCKETLQNILGFNTKTIDISRTKSVQNLDTLTQKSVQNLDSECPKFGQESAKSVQNLDAHLIRDIIEKKENKKEHPIDAFDGVLTNNEIHELIKLPSPAHANGEHRWALSNKAHLKLLGFHLMNFGRITGLSVGARSMPKQNGIG